MMDGNCDLYYVGCFFFFFCGRVGIFDVWGLEEEKIFEAASMHSNRNIIVVLTNTLIYYLFRHGQISSAIRLLESGSCVDTTLKEEK